jgi:glycosyltransferase involved in cell wall biosynthesis
MFGFLDNDNTGNGRTYYLDCERMRHPRTGIYEYCRRLGNSLAENLSPDETLGTYAPALPAGTFDSRILYVKHWHYHKFLRMRLQKPALWHATYQKSNYIPTDGTPVLLTIHDLNYLYEDKSAASIRRNNAMVQANIDKANAVIAISKFVADDIKTHLKVDPAHVHVIYNGCDQLDAVPPEAPGYEPRHPFIFTIGPTNPKKNFRVLPALLRHNDFELVIAGYTEEPYRSQIVEDAVRFGAGERVHIVGPISEANKAWYFRNCAAFAFPSIAEGFGLPVIEAMQFGKPAFLSRCTSLPETGGDCAYYFDSFDPDHMSEVFDKTMSTGVSADRSNQIRTHALSFSWEHAAQEYLKLYRQYCP